MEHNEQSSADSKLGARLDAGYGHGANLYRVLDIEPGASRVEVREAYLRLKSTYNAGSAALYSLISEDEAKEQLALVEDAFRVLNDEVQRRDYDQQLGIGRQPSRQTAVLGDFDAGAADAAGLHTERLIYARDTAAAANSPQTSTLWSANTHDDPTMIRTTRSTMPVIKLKANRAGGDDIKAQMQVLVDASDPGDGDLFKRLREAAQVTEQEMQDRTKVSVDYIKAIETNRFERLPQAVYVKGFLRSYFRYLCAPDAEKMVAAYSARLTDWQANKKR